MRPEMSKAKRPSTGPGATPCRPSAPPVSADRLVSDLAEHERDAERHHEAREIGAAKHEKARREA